MIYNTNKPIESFENWNLSQWVVLLKVPLENFVQKRNFLHFNRITKYWLPKTETWLFHGKSFKRNNFLLITFNFIITYKI